MTTVAWDGETLASDTGAWAGNSVRRVQKIFRLSNGDLLAGAGTYEDLLAARDYFQDGGSKPILKDFSGLLITSSGAFKLEDKLIRSPILEKFIAIGSGRDFAIAAMHCGKSAVEALEIALLFDGNTRAPIESMVLG